MLIVQGTIQSPTANLRGALSYVRLRAAAETPAGPDAAEAQRYYTDPTLAILPGLATLMVWGLNLMGGTGSGRARPETPARTGRISDE